MIYYIVDFPPSPSATLLVKKIKFRVRTVKFGGKRDLIVEFPPSRKFYYIVVFPGGKSARGEKRLYNSTSYAVKYK